MSMCLVSKKLYSYLNFKHPKNYEKVCFFAIAVVAIVLTAKNAGAQCVVNFTFTPIGGYQVQFDASTTVVPGGVIQSYEWVIKEEFNTVPLSYVTHYNTSTTSPTLVYTFPANVARKWQVCMRPTYIGTPLQCLEQWYPVDRCHTFYALP